MTSARRQSGLTLVEMAITMLIFAILVAAAAPSFTGFLANTQIRSASDSLRNGLRVAQMEAIKRNRPVELVLTDSAPTSSTVTALATGRNWVIRTARIGGGFDLLQGFAGASQVPRVTLSADRSIFAFDAFGRLTADSAGNAAPAADLAVAITDSDSKGRPLRVVVRTGGSSISCDPNATAGTPFACS
ncbi:MAG: GspH/FimT family pseudopilin [Burkholderiales bacterium]|nr:GspH/FimT family pseudopilin [Burkholderiales bacterium]